MALVEGCKHALEISVPVQEVESETARVTADVQKRAKLPGLPSGQSAGFPDSQILRRRYPAEGARSSDPQAPAKAVRGGKPQRGGHARYLRCPPARRRAAAFQGRIRGRSRNRAEGLQRHRSRRTHDPEVSDEDVDKRIEEIREQKAEYVNVDPAPGRGWRSRGGRARKPRRAWKAIRSRPTK